VIKIVRKILFNDKIILKDLQDNSLVEINSGPRMLDDIPRNFYNYFFNHK